MSSFYFLNFSTIKLSKILTNILIVKYKNMFAVQLTETNLGKSAYNREVLFLADFLEGYLNTNTFIRNENFILLNDNGGKVLFI